MPTAPAPVIAWLGPAGEQMPIKIPHGEADKSLLGPPDARLVEAGAGFAGFFQLTLAGETSTLKLRRTASNADPTETFDAFPGCPEMPGAQARAGKKTVFEQRYAQAAGAFSIRDADVEVWVFEDRRGFGYYARIDFQDPLDKVSQESSTIGCCAAGGPASFVRLDGRLPERALRSHVGACLSLARTIRPPK